MKSRFLKSAPVLITVGVLAAAAALQALRVGPLEQLEWKTFDWRARLARRFNPPVATNLGFVYIADASIAALQSGELGFRYGLYWPRHVYGRLIRELSAQGATGIAIDILFGELRPDHAPVQVNPALEPELEQWLTTLHKGEQPLKVGDTLVVESDDFFAWQLRRAANVILAAESMLPPHPLFATNALRLGDISSEPDADGILRRVKAFKDYLHWHPLFKLVEADPSYGVDLRKARIESDRIVLPRTTLEPIVIPLDADGNFDVADFIGESLPPGMPPRAKPFTTERVWHIGIALAAQELGLDLANAEIDLAKGQILLRGTGGLTRRIPTDSDGWFYIDWNLDSTDPRLQTEPVEELLRRHIGRGQQASHSTHSWRRKLVIIGSAATGSDLADRGATPLEKDALLASGHWNVANSVLTGRFVRRACPAVEMAVVCLLGAVAAPVSWRLGARLATGGVVSIACVYIFLSTWAYTHFRYWLPVVLPLIGGVLLVHVGLVTHRVVFEEKERRRIKAIFAKLVSPDVVQVLLSAERLPLGGAPREVTVMFADLRAFTELTELSRAEAEKLVHERGLRGPAAEVCFEQHAREALATVNLYLSVAAETVKRYNGTLDKYIGDCVMAFWGAPAPDKKHAINCIEAAIATQRAVEALNRERAAENARRQQQNTERARAGDPPLPMLPILQFGIGINSGTVTVGLMGSAAHILNYTVFGRDVNLASRLQNSSAGGQILIGEATFKQIAKLDPALADRCTALPPAALKGIREPIQMYEVKWI